MNTSANSLVPTKTAALLRKLRRGHTAGFTAKQAEECFTSLGWQVWW
jgi:hypothetical protein